MEKKPLRIYVDTSVFGGVFDREFAEPSKLFFHQTRLGVFNLVTSVLVRNEIMKSPDKVIEHYKRLSNLLEICDIDNQALYLQEAYLQAGVVTRKWSDDALHVALATVAGCLGIVSWNFKHIVHVQKVPLYNAINSINGYGNLTIVSPSEVIQYED
jgi:hypothetical protein